MIQMLVQMTFAMLGMICLSSCGGVPLVTVHHLDMKHNVSNPTRLTKYNTETCALEGVREPVVTLLDPRLHGAYCVSAADFAKLKTKAVQNCEKAKINESTPTD